MDKIAAATESAAKHAPRLPITISIVALLFSGLALVISWMEYQDNHRIAIAQGTPRIEFETAGDEEDLPVGVNIANPSGSLERIKHIAYYLDRKPIGDVDKLIDAADLSDAAYEDIADGTNFAVGEKIWLLHRDAKPRNAQERKDMDHFLDIVQNHVGIEVEVCSTISGTCMTDCSTDGWCK